MNGNDDNIEIFGVPVSTMGMDEAVVKVRGWLDDNRLRVVLTPNTEQVVMCYDESKKQKAKIKKKEARSKKQEVRVNYESRIKNQELTLRECFKLSDLNVCDSRGLKWGANMTARRLGSDRRIKERVAGVDLMEKLVVEASHMGKNVFLLGGRGKTAEEAAARLKERYPKLKVAGFVGSETVVRETKVEFEESLQRIAEHKTDLLLVGFGAPVQEQWVMRHRADLKKAGVKVAMVVGQGIDVWAGVVRRAPLRWRKIGLEWLWRLWHEPWRWRRQVRLLRFVVLMSRRS